MEQTKFRSDDELVTDEFFSDGLTREDFQGMAPIIACGIQ
jgi:hypothetical protein